jgi:prepilin-type N-terminal cleavage/methylation domain-containing protein
MEEERVMLRWQGSNIKSIRQRGFSLIELMAALGVVATMLAFVIPSLTVASRNYKLKAFAKEIEGQLQNARITAINRNKSTSLVFSLDNSWYYLDANGNGTADSGESTYWVPTGGYTLNITAPSTALSSTVLGTTSNPTALPNRGVSFSPRGSINQVNSSQVGLSTKLSAPGVIYLKDSSNNYGAVTITSAGRIKSWTLRGMIWR